MWYSLIPKFIWNYKFLLTSLILVSVVFLQHNTVKRERIEFKSEIQAIELNNSKQKHLLVEKARELERNLNIQLSKNSEIKREKDEKVYELNSVINSNSGRLQQLTKRSTVEANKRSCTNTTTTKVIDKVIRVPSSGESQSSPGEVDSNPTVDMLVDFEGLSATCASNYESLKNEAEELQNWSKAVMENSEIK